MRKRLWSLSVLLSLLVCSSLARSQDPPSAVTTGRIGVINIQEAIIGTGEGKKALADIQKKYEPRRNDLQRQEQEISALQDQLQKQANTLSDEEKLRLQRELDEKQRLFKRAQEDAQADYQNDNQEAIRRVGQKMVRVINEYAQQNGFVLVVDDSQLPVYFVAKGNDLTDVIMKRYDAANPAASAAVSSTPPAKPAAPSKPADKPKP
jgi:Skp family chaperone for outer membrane proteins